MHSINFRKKGQGYPSDDLQDATERINRIAAQGRMREIQIGMVLYDQGERDVPFFAVVSGELAIVQPTESSETLVAVCSPGQFTGEVNTLSGR